MVLADCLALIRGLTRENLDGYLSHVLEDREDIQAGENIFGLNFCGLFTAIFGGIRAVPRILRKNLRAALSCPQTRWDLVKTSWTFARDMLQDARHPAAHSPFVPSPLERILLPVMRHYVLLYEIVSVAILEFHFSGATLSFFINFTMLQFQRGRPAI